MPTSYQTPPPARGSDKEATVEDRLTELEIKVVFSEDLLEELDRTVYRQQQQIEELREELRALRRQVQESAAGEPRDTGDEVPPHY